MSMNLEELKQEANSLLLSDLLELAEFCNDLVRALQQEEQDHLNEEHEG